MVFGREPVMWLAVIQAALAGLIAFGFDLTADQTAGVMALAAAVLGFVARAQVTPTSDPRLPGRTPRINPDV